MHAHETRMLVNRVLDGIPLLLASRVDYVEVLINSCLSSTYLSTVWFHPITPLPFTVRFREDSFLFKPHPREPHAPFSWKSPTAPSSRSWYGGHPRPIVDRFTNSTVGNCSSFHSQQQFRLVSAISLWLNRTRELNKFPSQILHRDGPITDLLVPKSTPWEPFDRGIGSLLLLLEHYKRADQSRLVCTQTLELVRPLSPPPTILAMNNAFPVSPTPIPAFPYLSLNCRLELGFSFGVLMHKLCMVQ